MADFSQGVPPPPPPMMHTGRIPSFKNNHGESFQNRCGPEPPACVQNAMMTKDKKPFTYTPGGLDLSQIRTPSMARRLQKQQQQMEDQNNPTYFQSGSSNGGGPPPPPPPPPSGGPPPPPPLVINVTKPTKPIAEGERPEIVIPENPVGMLRKTNSPYHWESELGDRLREGPVPKFVEKSATPSPQMMMRPQPPRQFTQQAPQPQLPQPQPPRQFSQQSPQAQSPQYTNQQQIGGNKSPASPVYKPEPKYPQPNETSTQSPSFYQQSPTKDMLQRQDSQFNHSPSPWPRDSSSNTSPSVAKSATPISGPPSPWRQDNRSPNNQQGVQSPVQVDIPVQMSPAQARSPVSPQSFQNNRQQSVQSPEVQQNAAPWRQQQSVRQEPPEKPPQFMQQQNRSPLPPQPSYAQAQPAQYVQCESPDAPPEVRFQTHMTIPVTPKPKPNNPPSNQDIFSPRVMETPKENMPWARNDSAINKSTPQPPWCQNKETNQKTQSRDAGPQPPWIQEQQQQKQQPQQNLPQGRVIPIQMELAMNDISHQHHPQEVQPAPRNPNLRINPQGPPAKGQQPQLRIIIGVNPNQQQQQPQQQQQQQGQQYNNQPAQQITRVLQPQMVRMDERSVTSPPVQETPQQHQPKTRIIPIQMEPASPVSPAPRVLQHQISREFAPRQSKAFRVLQVITGTDEDPDELENQHGFTDL